MTVTSRPTGAHNTSRRSLNCSAISFIRRSVAEKGKKIAETQRSASHRFNNSASTLVGPDVYGVPVSKIATIPGYSFSAAMRKLTGDQNATSLNEWLKSPSTLALGTYMTFPGLPSQAERDDVITYLKCLK